MTVDDIRDYCLSKQKTTESFPFDEHLLVFKVLDKLFLLVSLKKWEEGEPAINLKCDPDYAVELRAQYQSIVPGYHMNKKHWNTLYLNKGDLSPEFVFQLIDHSYKMIIKAMPKKLRDCIND